MVKRVGVTLGLWQGRRQHSGGVPRGHFEEERFLATLAGPPRRRREKWV